MSGKSTIKNLLTDFEAEPSPAVWNSIQFSLAQDKKRNRRKFLLLFLAFVVISGGLTGWLINRPAEKHLKNSGSEKIIAQETTVHPAEDASPSVSNRPASENKIRDNDPNKNSFSNTGLIPKNKTQKTVPGKKTKRESVFIYASENKPGHPDSNAFDSTELIASISPLNAKQNSFLPGNESPSLLAALTVSKQKKFLSRWQAGISFGLGNSYRQYKPAAKNNPDESMNLDANEQSAHSIESGINVTYDLSPHFAIRSGVSYYTSAFERTYSRIIVSSVPGQPQQYAISSSLGEVWGNGSELNVVFYDDADLSLVPPQTGVAAGLDNPEVFKEFSFLEKFEFISVPFSLVYKPVEMRFTPYASIGAGVNYLAASTFYADGKKIHYSFVEEPAQWSITSLAFVGLSYRLSHHLSMQAESGFRYSLTSLAADKKTKWRPYAWLGSLGVNYRF